MDWPEIWCLMEVSTMFYICIMFLLGGAKLRGTHFLMGIPSLRGNTCMFFNARHATIHFNWNMMPCLWESTGYLKNHWTKVVLVCIHSDVFFMLIPNMERKFNISDIIWNFMKIFKVWFALNSTSAGSKLTQYHPRHNCFLDTLTLSDAHWRSLSF